MNIKINFLAVLFILMLNKPGQAQEFNNISVKDGLSNNAIFSIQQYNKGLIWVSTKTGIDRFDGSHFRHYSLYGDDKLLKYGHRVSKIKVDRFDRLWVHTNYDVFLYNKENDKFNLVYTTADNNIIHDLVVVDPENVLMATDKGLTIYHIGNKKLSVIPGIPRTNKLLKYSDKLVVLVQRDKLHVFDLQTRSIRGNLIKPGINEGLKGLNITALGADRKQNIFIGVPGKVFTFRLEQDLLYSSDKLNSKFNNCDIRKFLIDNDNNVFIGTDGAGIYKVNTGLQILRSYISDQDDPGTLLDNSVSDIFIDGDGRIWVGGRGLSYADPNKLRFLFIEHQRNKANSLIHNFVRTIVEDVKGNLLIGTKYGISVLNRKTSNWEHITRESSNNALGTNKILSFHKDQQGNILVGTYQGGLFGIDQNYRVSPKNHGSSKNIYSILSSPGTLWISGNSGIEKIDVQSGRVTKFAIPYVLSMTRNKKGDLIAGGHSGISVISGHDSILSFDALTHKTGSIFCVMVDSKNNLWAASEGQGLMKFIEKAGTFKKYTRENGLPSNIIYGILEDKRGNLWLSTTNGLSRFNPVKEEFTNYSVSDGLNIKEFNFGANTKTSAGELIFGGINGLVIFKPEEIIDKKLNSNLLFTDLRLFNHSVEPGAEGSPLQKVIDETDHVILDYDQDAIAIEFTTVNYTNPKKTVYRWKLEGVDKDWSPAGIENTATYTNLKPGKYVFKVRSSNHPLYFTGNERTLDITVHPPFWQTYWAYLVYLILAGSVIYLISRFYYIRINEMHAKSKIKFFINIAHDIRTPLSLIKSPLTLAIRKNDFSSGTLKTLKTAEENTERLSHLINQLLDFERADSTKTDLDLSTIYAERTLRDLSENFMSYMDQRGIEFISHFEQTDTILCVDKDKFSTIIYNLLSNAIKYTPRGGVIKLSTQVTANKLQIRISDNGLGIPEEQQKYIFKRYFRAQNAINSNEVGSGIGLMLTKKLVELHKGGSISFSSEANKGTTFIVIFQLDDSQEMVPQLPASDTEAIGEVELADSLNSRKPKLLIVEDHQSLRNHLVENLKNDYRVHTAENGKVALTVIKKIFPDIIVSDVMMPEMNGNQLCYDVKNNIETSHIPFILLTSLIEDQYKIEGIKTGADIYLEKPFNLELLKTCMVNLLENRKRLRDKFINDNESPEELSSLDKKFIETAMNILEKNISNSEFSIETFEKELGMSHAALYRKFKTLIGKTPLDYINQFRLKKAAELLQQGEYNVNEVAYMVGFSDPKYFSTVFKKFFGANASEFLRK